jgi:hypothetical protein
VVPVVEQGEVPAQVHLREEALQRAGLLGELEPEEQLVCYLTLSDKIGSDKIRSDRIR